MYRIKTEPVDAEQWFPGKYVDGVQEAVYDPGDGSTKPYGHGICGGKPVKPGDWIVSCNGEHHVIAPDWFAAAYEPLS